MLRLLADAPDGLLTMTIRPDGVKVQLNPGVRFPLRDLRFKREDLEWLATSNGGKRIATTSNGSTKLVPIEGELKKAALVAKHKSKWPTIERDISNGVRNGLSYAAKSHYKNGWWREAEALAWAKQHGRLSESTTRH